jgi:hypothetical protein
VSRQEVIHTAIQELLLDGCVDDQVRVHVLGPQSGIG